MEPKVWNEGGQSSKHDDLANRPVLASLLTEIEQGKVKHLWVFNTDRLSRNENTWSAIRVKLLQNDVKLYTATGTFELSNPLDKLLLGILSEISSYDNYLRAERSRLGKLNRLREGLWIGGPSPYGYTVKDRKLVPDPKEAKWVKFIFEEYVAGKSVQAIRAALIRAGALPRHGNRIWSTGSIEALLRNTHFAGYYKVRDRKTGEEFTLQCDSIVSPTVHEQYLKSKERRSIRRVVESNLKQFYLLRDFLVCDHCGSFYSGRHYPKQYRAVYYCPRRERLRDDPYSKHLKRCEQGVYLRIEDTDDLVWESVVDVLSKSHWYKEEIKNLTLGTKRTHRDQKQEVAALNKRLKSVDSERQRVEGILGSVQAGQLINQENKHQFEGVIQTIQKEIEGLRTKRSEMLKRVRDAETTARWTDWVAEFGTKITELRKMTGERRKEFLKGVVDTIRVKKLSATKVQLRVAFRRPYVGDRLIKRQDSTSKNQVVDGTNLLEVPLEVTKRKARVGTS